MPLDKFQRFEYVRVTGLHTGIAEVPTCCEGIFPNGPSMQLSRGEYVVVKSVFTDLSRLDLSNIPLLKFAALSLLIGQQKRTKISLKASALRVAKRVIGICSFLQECLQQRRCTSQCRITKRRPSRFVSLLPVAEAIFVNKTFDLARFPHFFIGRQGRFHWAGFAVGELHILMVQVATVVVEITGAEARLPYCHLQQNRKTWWTETVPFQSCHHLGP